jgi:hypothetical protein
MKPKSRIGKYTYFGLLLIANIIPVIGIVLLFPRVTNLMYGMIALLMGVLVAIVNIVSIRSRIPLHKLDSIGTFGWVWLVLSIGYIGFAIIALSLIFYTLSHI